MSDILRRSLAPVSEEAWRQIDIIATRTLKANLSGRRLVDLDGPHGWELAAVNLGRLKINEEHKARGVSWGVRQVLPLLEFRVPFSLDIMELDQVSRGSRDPHLDPLIEAAEKAAGFEESAIYKGFAQTQIKGIVESSSHQALKLPENCEALPSVLAEGVKALRGKDIDGPYAVVLGSNTYHCLLGSVENYPTYKVVQQMFEAGVYLSRAVEGGVLLSARGGDFELTLGQDISIGYATHNLEKVELYFTESFTFRVLEKSAAVALAV